MADFGKLNLRFHLIRRLRSLWTHGITSLP